MFPNKMTAVSPPSSLPTESPPLHSSPLLAPPFTQFKHNKPSKSNTSKTPKQIAMDVKICQEKLMKSLNLTIEKVRVSFIERLFPQICDKKPVLLISHVDPQIERRISPKTESEDAASLLEVTGSPLEHSFGDDNFNLSITPTKRNWWKSEEKYTPIFLRMATELVKEAAAELEAVDLLESPIFCLVDPSENDEANDQCILIGQNPISNGFMTIRASCRGLRLLGEVADLPGLIVEHRLDQFNPKRTKKENVEIRSVYELCGTNPEMIDWGEGGKRDYGGHLRIESSWEELCFLPASRKSNSTLIASIASGSKDSPLSSLWEELLLLDKYLVMLEQYRTRHLTSRYSVAPLDFPKDFINPFIQSTSIITTKIRRLLSGDEDLDESQQMEEDQPVESSSDADYVIKLVDLLKILDSRQNQDFTDVLWRIIKTADSYTTMTDCIHAVFEEIAHHDYKPQLNIGDETRFAKFVGDLEASKQLPQLAGSVAMELAIDAGLEKINRDYTYLLSSGNFMEVYDVRKMLERVAEGEFVVDKYREKLMTLAQIHISLEFLILIQNQLNCRIDISHSIFEAALKIYRGNDSPLKPEDLKNHEIYSLSVPAPREFVNEVMKGTPSSWMCTLTTTSKDQDFSTVTHNSRTPIFPPNILTIGDSHKVDDEAGQETYYTTKASIIHFKLG